MLEQLIKHYETLYGKELSLTALEVELKKFVLDKTMKTDMILVSKFTKSQVRTVSDALAVIKELEERVNGDDTAEENADGDREPRARLTGRKKQGK